MSEENKTLTQEEVVVDQLKLLKERADLMGLSYPRNAGLEKMREILAAAQNTEESEAEEPEGELTTAQIRQKVFNDAMRLVRVRITNLNPAKADIPGEMITVSNKYIGRVTRVVPYMEHDAWHVEQCILDAMLDRKFAQHRTTRSGANQLPSTKWVKEFAIEILPDLTEAELKRLANKQAAAAGMTD